MNEELRLAIEIVLTYAKGVAKDYAQGAMDDEVLEAVAVLENAVKGT